MLNQNTNITGSTILKEMTTPDFRHMSSTTNLEGKEIVDVPGKDGNASIPEPVKRPNPWRKIMLMDPFIHYSKYNAFSLKRKGS
jgi:hypothetical protein